MLLSSVFQEYFSRIQYTEILDNVLNADKNLRNDNVLSDFPNI